MNGRCDECDQPQIWAGTGGWHPHSEQQHAAARRRLHRAVLRVLAERAAVLAGHKITIRFTWRPSSEQTMAWAECSCGWRGLTWPDSGYARGDGHDHLADLGRLLVSHTLLTSTR